MRNLNYEENCNVFSAANFVGMTIDNLCYPSEGSQDENFPDEIIWDVNKGKENFKCSLILYEVQLVESNKYKLVEILYNNLEIYTSDLFVAENMIFNEVEGILLIQVRADGKIVLFLYNMQSRIVEETITVFKNEPRLEYDRGSTKIFFVNHTDFEGGIIVAVSHIVKQIKVFCRCGKVDYRLLFCESLNVDVRDSRDYGAYCVSNRNNQILFFVVQKSGITVYDLFDKSNKTLFAVRDIENYGMPVLNFNKSGEEFYLRYCNKFCVCLYRSMLKSLALHAASIVVQSYTKSQLKEMQLPGNLYKYLKLLW